MAENTRAWSKANRERKALANIEWNRANPEANKAIKRKSAIKNQEKRRPKQLALAKRYADELNDIYILTALRMTRATAPPALIEAKRMQLKLLRLLKEKNDDHDRH